MSQTGGLTCTRQMNRSLMPLSLQVSVCGHLYRVHCQQAGKLTCQVTCYSELRQGAGWHVGLVVRRSLGLFTAVWRTNCSTLREEEERSWTESRCTPPARKVTSHTWHQSCPSAHVLWRENFHAVWVLRISLTILSLPIRHQQVCGGDRDRGGAWWPCFVHYDVQHLQTAKTSCTWVRKEASMMFPAASSLWLTSGQTVHYTVITFHLRIQPQFTANVISDQVKSNRLNAAQSNLK